MGSNLSTVNKTKEIQLLKFTIGGNPYGLNLDNVSEILPYVKPTKVPNSHLGIEGLVMPRDFIITVIDPAQSMNLKRIQGPEERLVVTSYDNMNIAIHVDSVEGILHATMHEDIIRHDRFGLGDVDVKTFDFSSIDIDNIDLDEIDSYVLSQENKEFEQYVDITEGYVEIDDEQFIIINFESMIKKINPTI